MKPLARTLAAVTPTVIAVLAGLACPGITARADQMSSDGASGPTRPSVAPASTPAPDRASRGNAERPSLTPAVSAEQAEYDAYAALGYKLQWRGFPTVGRGHTAKIFEAFGDRLLFQDTGNSVTLLDAATGSTRWSTQPDTPLARFVGSTITGDRVYAASEGELFELDARTGELLQRHRLASVVNTRPVITGDLAVFGCAAGGVLGHNLRSTYKLWAYSTDVGITSDLAPAPGAGPNSTGPIAAVTQDGEVVILDPQSGRSVGRARFFGGVASNPIADRDTLYAASTDQSVYAVELRGGSIRWRYRTEQPITAQPTLHNGALYVHIPGEGLVSLDAATGAVRWRSPAVAGVVIAQRAGHLVVWDGAVAATVDPARGDVVSRAEIPGLKRLIADPFVDGALYAVTPAGRVSKFGPK